MYEVSRSVEPPTPRLPGHVLVRADEDGAIDALAADLFIHAQNCTRAFGDFHLGVSVTPASEPLLRRMMYDPAVRGFPWSRTRLWLTDERSTDPESSRGVALSELWGTHSGIPADQVHTVSEVSEGGAAAYAADLRQVLGWRERGHDRIDAVVMTLGADGGVAGLGPGAPAAGDDLVRFDPAEGSPRVTMTMHLINAARFVAILACGPGVREAIAGVIRARRVGGTGPPAASLAPLGGDLRWYLDRDACPGPVPL